MRAWAIVLLAACATAPEEPTAPGNEDEPTTGPDAAALAIPTLMKARTASLRISERWRDEVKLEGIQIERPDDMTMIARGSAVVVVRQLRVEASEEIEIKFLSRQNDTVLLHGREVVLFQQKKGYVQRTENLSAVTMANEEVRYWSQ